MFNDASDLPVAAIQVHSISQEVSTLWPSSFFSFLSVFLFLVFFLSFPFTIDVLHTGRMADDVTMDVAALLLLDAGLLAVAPDGSGGNS